jgi:Putative peptidoglycan binding domain
MCRTVVALSTVALLLWLPATSSARDATRTGAPQTEQGRSSLTALRTAGLLAFGAGYGTERGSTAVRGLQLRLRTLGLRPGPIDGLFGPLTRGAVLRFQRAHGLVADGLVGAHTRNALVAGPTGRTSRPSGADRREHAARDRAGLDRPTPVEAPPPQAPMPDIGGAADVATESSGLAPGVAAALGALVTALLLGGLWLLGSRRRGGSPAGHRPEPTGPPGIGVRVGMACAALLAVLALGAAAGALFANQATPDQRETKDAVTTGAVLEPIGAAGEGQGRSRGSP